MTDPNLGLMTLIRTKWGAQIAAACAGTAVPESFLAGLVANESGGDATKTRFEPIDFAEMCETIVGKRSHFEGLGSLDLLPVPSGLQVRDGLQVLVNFATSWGLTQIMGYQTIPFHRTVSSLMVPADHLKFAGVLLVQFANRWDLSLSSEPLLTGSGISHEPPLTEKASDLEKLFACWNCGQPYPEKTFDPHYCANGMLRMSLYPPAADVTGD